jgi:hypothetical protein
MKILRKGQIGTEVSQLQQMLQEKGYSVAIDGNFGSQTYLSVYRFQKDVNLPADGIVGENTWRALLGETSGQSSSEPESESNTIQQGSEQKIDFEKAAAILGVEEAAVKAVYQVESGGRSGFLPDGRPLILFEGHIFWKQLKKHGIDPETYASENSDILFPKWDRTSYKGGAAEYERLDRALAIHEESAYCAASWGMFQIMGFNYRLCGYNTVFEYVSDMKVSGNNQLLAFIKFLQNTQMDVPLKKLDWAAFAAKYNGPGYKQHHYDEKLEYAYRQHKNSSN